MEPFEIQLVGTTYIIQPKDEGQFEVFEGEKYIGELVPVIANTASGVRWNSPNINEDFADQLGELIMEHDM